MFTRIWHALKARRTAVLEAEASVLRYGSQCGAAARALAADPMAVDGRAAHYGRVARLAERKYDLYRGLDTATKYEEEARWRNRRGSLIR